MSQGESGWEAAILQAIPSGIDLAQLDRCLQLTPTERLERMRELLLSLREATRAANGNGLPSAG
jgi:hypothetical protein